MSEQTNTRPARVEGFMAELDAWSESAVITPLLDNESEISLESTIEGVKKAIRAKVLESYRNGQAVGPTKPRGFQRRHLAQRDGAGS